MYLCTCYSEQYRTSQSGIVISSQISKDFLQLPENESVQLKFHYVSIAAIMIQFHNVAK